MSDSNKIIVPVRLAERSYEIEIATNNLKNVLTFCKGLGKHHCVIITDSNVAPLYAEPIAVALSACDLRVSIFEVPAGEASKCVEQWQELLKQMLEEKADRSSLVIAVGGGVIGDLAGFVAASYARGIDFLQVPTTLLAQVDSSIGGKTGINLPNAKNMVGAFHQPKGVLIDTNVLTTLSDREYRAGLAEVIKYAVILDVDFFAFLENSIEKINQRDPETLRKIIARSCELKAEVVKNDERETTGLRAILNYGHTFGHAFEAVAGYGELLHGEAVAIGMVCASRFAEQLGWIDAEVTDRQVQLLKQVGLPTEPPQLDQDQLVAAMNRDKKAEQGRVNFILPREIGRVEIARQLDPNDARSVLGAVS